MKKNLTPKVSYQRTRKESRSWLFYAIFSVIGVSLLGVVLATTHESISRKSLELSIPVEATSSPQVEQSELSNHKQLDKRPEWINYTIKPGDSASAIFDQYQIHSSFLQINEIPVTKKALKNIHPGQTLSLKLDWRGLRELNYHVSETKRLNVTHDGQKYSAKLVEEEIETRRLSASGTIKDSLFVTGKRSGISDSIIMQLVDIFSYDIDFALDIREGDKFELIYEEHFANGIPLKRSGPILAAQFINQKKTFTALRFTDSKGKAGYYSPKGRSNKKAFIRTPVKFSRISSHFNPNRKHPILHTIRAHKGVDYAAPTGTAVKSTGKGRIQFIGRKGGYGKVVIVKHAGGYSTLYAHLSRFKKGMKRGKAVKQGQTIGYVGKTGSATGPHLHYEFRVKGKHKNPLTVKLPNAPSLYGDRLQAFKSATQPFLVQLTSLDKFAATK